MRERKRDWPVIVYKFWARPLGDMPEELWKIAHEINNVWNTLVDLRAGARDQTMAPKDKEQKKAIWKAFWLEARDRVKASQLNWEIKGEIFDRFVIAHRRATKEQWEMKPHRGLRRVMIPHRFTGGGIPIAKIFDMHSTAKRLKIEPVAAEAYRDSRRSSKRQRLTHGVFKLSDSAKIEFETILHRSIPNEAILKKSLWVGEFHRSLPVSQRWSWSLNLVCEIPKEQYCRTLPIIDRPVCAVDFGWRVMLGGEYLRIGMIVDSLGRAIELRLPLFMGRKRDEKKQGWVSSLHDLIAFDSKIDLELEEAKTKVAEVFFEKPAGFEKMRQNGLRKLLRETTDQRLISVLTEWEERNNKLCAIRAAVRGRIRRRKSWLYQNLAAWLAATYSSVILEGNFSLKLMSERADHPALRNAAKYRQWAGLGELRTAIKNAAKKYGCEIVEVEAFDTTRRCAVCSAEHEGSKAKLYLECSNGHRWDQDFNAASNLLLSQGGGDSALAEGLSVILDTSSKNPLNIPANLKAVLVPCSFQ